MKKDKPLRLGFDLDGVLIGKPFFIPQSWLEYLFRGKRQKKLHYRYPKTKLEIWIRKFSHFYLFRPPLKENIENIKQIQQKRSCWLYVVSGRYSFLEKETKIWLKKRNLEDVFIKVFINLNDEQPHLFKEKTIKKLNLDYFFEDDPQIVDYLKSKISQSRIKLINRDHRVVVPLS